MKEALLKYATAGLAVFAASCGDGIDTDSCWLPANSNLNDTECDLCVEVGTSGFTLDRKRCKAEGGDVRRSCPDEPTETVESDGSSIAFYCPEGVEVGVGSVKMVEDVVDALK